jgi:hypothetical protein
MEHIEKKGEASAAVEILLRHELFPIYNPEPSLVTLLTVDHPLTIPLLGRLCWIHSDMLRWRKSSVGHGLQRALEEARQEESNRKSRQATLEMEQREEEEREEERSRFDREEIDRQNEEWWEREYQEEMELDNIRREEDEYKKWMPYFDLVDDMIVAVERRRRQEDRAEVCSVVQCMTLEVERRRREEDEQDKEQQAAAHQLEVVRSCLSVA